jgi:hypothetical protein
MEVQNKQNFVGGGALVEARFHLTAASRRSRATVRSVTQHRPVKAGDPHGVLNSCINPGTAVSLEPLGKGRGTVRQSTGGRFPRHLQLSELSEPAGHSLENERRLIEEWLAMPPLSRNAVPAPGSAGRSGELTHPS